MLINVVPRVSAFHAGLVVHRHRLILYDLWYLQKYLGGEYCFLLTQIWDDGEYFHRQPRCVG